MAGDTIAAMLIIGSTVRKRSVGFAADYCTVCRAPSVMQVREHRAVRTIYFVPVTAGRAFELWASCQDCGSRFVRPVDHYAGYLPTAGPLDDLADRTNPGLLGQAAAREALEIELLEGDADPRARLMAIEEVIRSLEADAISRQVSGRYESVTTLVAAGAMAFTSAAFITAVTAPVWAWPMGAAAIPFWVWLVYRMVRGQTRARGRIVEQRVARAIAPLGPTDEELTTVCKALARAGSTVSRGLDLPRLRRLLDAQLDADQ
jgi:hypothetical protein